MHKYMPHWTQAYACIFVSLVMHHCYCVIQLHVLCHEHSWSQGASRLWCLNIKMWLFYFYSCKYVRTLACPIAEYMHWVISMKGVDIKKTKNEKVVIFQH
jgi:hypothetical protein